MPERSVEFGKPEIHLKRRRKLFAAVRHGILQPAAMFVLGASLLLIVSISRGGSIFDDDFTPPKRADPEPDQPVPTPPETPAIPAPENPRQPAIKPPGPQVPIPTTHHKLPDTVSRATCRKLFEKVYAKELKDRAPAARRKLAQKLLDEAGKAAEGSADRFVLLNGAIKAAEEGQSLRMCFSAAKQLAKEFGVDELAAKTDAATKTFAGASSPALSSVSNVEALMALADQLVAEDAFTTVVPVESALQRAMPGIADADLKAEVKSQIRDVASIREAKEKLAPAIEKLKQSPDDPAANLAAGSYLCFLRGHWDQGLPLLAKSSDAQLKNLAMADLAHPAGADKLSKLGDGWFAEASKLPAPDRSGAMQHAGNLYRSAAADMTGLQRLAIDKRFAQIPPSNRHRHVDLIDLFDPATSVVNGVWRMRDGSLACETGQFARVGFPYEPPEEYDFRISFTAIQQDQTIAQILSCAGHQFEYQVAAWHNTVAGFGLVGGVNAKDNKTSKHKARWLNAGQYYVSLVKVRKTGVEAYLDGQLVTSLKTDYSNVGPDGNWPMPRMNAIGFGALDDAVCFDSAEIVEITGDGKQATP